ncbi:MAG: hypothetical protein Q8K98_04620 [Bacteroidota bacterium]|nr:hypothetical protein [Bacteroidota bacterium]
MKYCIILMLVAIVSCREISGPISSEPIVPPVVDELIWVATLYVGGRQCDLNDSYTPPDVKLVLNEVGIRVYDTAIEYYAVCAACGCPSYAAMHFASISKEHLEQAEKLGFHQQDPPPTN